MTIFLQLSPTKFKQFELNCHYTIINDKLFVYLLPLWVSVFITVRLHKRIGTVCRYYFQNFKEML